MRQRAEAAANQLAQRDQIGYCVKVGLAALESHPELAACSEVVAEGDLFEACDPESEAPKNLPAL